MMKRLLIASEKSASLLGKDFGICFYNEALENAVNRETDIRDALSRIAACEESDELYLQYQPIIDLHTNSISCFEVLARLKTENLGIVSPLEFIPIAEKTKLILPIGERVILLAFRFMQKLKERGYEHIGVSINVSAIQLFEPNFVYRLFELIENTGVNPKNIIIEITESILANDYEYINIILENLRNSGLQVAIDDFGIGYSSLARVNELNVDSLKIDKYFVSTLMDSDRGNAIICDIISMSHKLGHYTVAEGVEHECQLEYLKRHSCDKIQGYLVSMPLDEKDAFEFLSAHKNNNEKSEEVGNNEENTCFV